MYDHIESNQEKAELQREEYRIREFLKGFAKLILIVARSQATTGVPLYAGIEVKGFHLTCNDAYTLFESSMDYYTV